MNHAQDPGSPARVARRGGDLRRGRRLAATAGLLIGTACGCVQDPTRVASPEAPLRSTLGASPDVIDAAFDPALPHPARLDGRTVVLPAGSETITPAERSAEVATVDRVLNSFLLDALPYRGPEYKIATTIVLDPNLIGEESRRAEPGLCYTASHTVVLNRDLWRAYGEAEREVVLYHELGHCELGRRHVEGLRPDGGPLSLMNRNSVAAVRYFIADRDYYVRELFTSHQAPAHFILHSRFERWPLPPKGKAG